MLKMKSKSTYSTRSPLNLWMMACILLGICSLWMLEAPGSEARPAVSKPVVTNDSAQRLIHVYVALCDNDSQGIVPVSKRMGNGNDPENNLYWGNGYGVRT